jgi:hypothetical protein
LHIIARVYSYSFFAISKPHERVAASAIYYYETDSDILEDGLALRRLRDPQSDFPGVDDYHHDASFSC